MQLPEVGNCSELGTVLNKLILSCGYFAAFCLHADRLSVAISQGPVREPHGAL